MNNYRETIYTCPSCGTSFIIPEIGDELPAPAPILLCPSCGLAAYRTSQDERFLLQNYRRTREETRTIIARRNTEQEAGR